MHSAINEMSIRPHSHIAEETLKKRGQKDYKTQTLGMISETECSGHDRSTALRSSERLWRPVQDYTKREPVKTPAQQRKEGLTMSTPFLNEKV